MGTMKFTSTETLVKVVDSVTKRLERFSESAAHARLLEIQLEMEIE